MPLPAHNMPNILKHFIASTTSSSWLHCELLFAVRTILGKTTSGGVGSPADAGEAGGAGGAGGGVSAPLLLLLLLLLLPLSCASACTAGSASTASTKPLEKKLAARSSSDWALWGSSTSQDITPTGVNGRWAVGG